MIIKNENYLVNSSHFFMKLIVLFISNLLHNFCSDEAKRLSISSLKNSRVFGNFAIFFINIAVIK